MDNYQEALDSFNKALKIHEELNDKMGMANDYHNISFVLFFYKKSNDGASIITLTYDEDSLV